MSDLIGTILPSGNWHEIKWAVEVRSGATDKTERAEIGSIPAGPSGFQAAPAQCVVRFARSAAARCIALLLARLAACDTELSPINSETV